MEGRISARRTVTILALAVITAGVLAASSVGAATPLTKAKVKKIATKVFNNKIGPATTGFLGNDISRHQTTSANNNSGFKTQSVDCPAGKYAIAGGGFTAVIFSSAEPSLTGSFPSGQNPQTTTPPTGWTVFASNYGPTDSWALNAVVVCATP